MCIIPGAEDKQSPPLVACIFCWEAGETPGRIVNMSFICVASVNVLPKDNRHCDGDLFGEVGLQGRGASFEDEGHRRMCS